MSVGDAVWLFNCAVFFAVGWLLSKARYNRS